MFWKGSDDLGQCLWKGSDDLGQCLSTNTDLDHVCGGDSDDHHCPQTVT